MLTAIDAINKLNDQSMAIVVFTSEELSGLCEYDLQDYLITKGNEWIAQNKSDDQEEE